MEQTNFADALKAILDQAMNEPHEGEGNRVPKAAKCYYIGEIPEQKLENAIHAYADGINPEDVLFLFDGFSNAKQGFLFTEEAFAASVNLRGKNNPEILYFHEMKEIHSDPARKWFEIDYEGTGVLEYDGGIYRRFLADVLNKILEWRYARAENENPEVRVTKWMQSKNYYEELSEMTLPMLARLYYKIHDPEAGLMLAYKYYMGQDPDKTQSDSLEICKELAAGYPETLNFLNLTGMNKPEYTEQEIAEAKRLLRQLAEVSLNYRSLIPLSPDYYNEAIEVLVNCGIDPHQYFAER